VASSIRQHGLLQPITVRAAGGGYEIVMGERRYRACQMLGFTHIDAFILPAGEEESALLALIENLQRQDLHYFEEAEAYAALLAGGITQETLARRLGKSASGIANKYGC
jgi:ParB family chromosome partitioning protein